MIPIAINVLRGRKMLPSTRAFVLPEWFAWFANLLSIAYITITTVLFVFPPTLPVTGSNMNYCIVVFTIVLAVSTFQWLVDGRKNYNGPKIELEGTVLTAVESVRGTGGPAALARLDSHSKTMQEAHP